MKRYSNIYNAIISRDNIEIAINNAMKGKHHYKEVIRIKANPQKYIDDLHTLLCNDLFKNSEYITFKKDTGVKIREIYKLPFYPDRVVHHCIVQVLMPIWMKILIRDTYSTIPNRGIHDGLKRIKTALKDQQNTIYTLKFDIKKYYPSVNHDVLLTILSKKIKDERVMNLLNEIIRSAPGIPIGNYISQWFGNMYLAYFDHYCKEDLKVKYYFRYADDIVILASTKEYLHDVFMKIRIYLKDELKLDIKKNYQIFPTSVRGIDFLGYRFFHTHILVRKSIVKNFKRKLVKSQLTGDRKRSQIESYKGWFIHANTHNLMMKYGN